MDQEQFAGAVIYISVEMLLWRKSARAPRRENRPRELSDGSSGVGKFHEISWKRGTSIMEIYGNLWEMEYGWYKFIYWNQMKPMEKTL